VPSKPKTDWGSLDGDAKALGGRSGGGCGVRVFLARLDPAGREAVTRALANDSLTASGLYKALASRLPDPPKAYTIRRHRHQECTCPTKK